MKLQFIVWPDFTLADLVGPLQVLTQLPGAETQIVWKAPGPVVSDTGVAVVATHSLSDAWKDVDLIMVPGGGGTMDRLHDDETLEFLADRGSRAGWVTSVCTGSLVLGVAGLLDGYEAASHWYTNNLLSRFGAIPRDARVVIDRNRVTGGGVTAGVDFGITMLAEIEGEQFAKTAELLIEYAPDPPFGTGRPELADQVTYQIAVDRLESVFPLDAVPEGVHRVRGHQLDTDRH